MLAVKDVILGIEDVASGNSPLFRIGVKSRAAVRSSLIIPRAQCKMIMQSPLFERGITNALCKGGNKREYRYFGLISSVHMHAPLSHWTLLTNHKLKDKIKNSKTVTAGY